MVIGEIQTESGLLSRLFFYKIMKEKSQKNQNFAKKKNHILRNIFIVSGILVFVAAVVCLGIFLIHNYNKNRITLKTIRQWENLLLPSVRTESSSST